MDYSSFQVLTFDCYGTLIDWESGIWDALQPLFMAAGRDDVSRKAALEAFARAESAIEAEYPALPYDQVLQKVHGRLAEHFGMRTDGALDEAFGESIAHWPAFPDTAEALRLLKRRFKLVILSNVHRAGFAASNRKLGVAFDAIFTAQDIGSYKPDLANFRYMLARLKEDFAIPPVSVLHVAQSLFHDHAPARRMGLANVWIDRQGLSRGGDWGATAKLREMPQVDAIFPDMRAFAAAASSPAENISP